MIRSCLRNVFAMVGCATLLVVGGVVAYQYRGQIAGAVRSVRAGERASAVPDSTVGRPTGEALRAAQHKIAEIERRDGPAFVVLNAGEMAALVEAGLDPAARLALDSLRVTLSDGRFALRATLRTSAFGRELLGPFNGILAEREPVRVAGPARLAETGLVAWTPTEFRIRAFPFPDVVIPRLVNRLTGRADGAFPIVVPVTVGDVRIRGDGVTFYRRPDRQGP